MNDYLIRALAAPLQEALQSAPVVVVTGARQTGKSTLVQMIGEQQQRSYFDLDDLTFSQSCRDPHSWGKVRSGVEQVRCAMRRGVRGDLGGWLEHYSQGDTQFDVTTEQQAGSLEGDWNPESVPWWHGERDSHITEGRRWRGQVQEDARYDVGVEGPFWQIEGPYGKAGNHCIHD